MPEIIGTGNFSVTVKTSIYVPNFSNKAMLVLWPLIAFMKSGFGSLIGS